MSKTDRQIIDEVNDLARTMLGYMGTGYTVPENYKFYQPDEKNDRILGAWSRAVEVYEKITHSEVHDALQAVLEDEAKPKPNPDAELLRAFTFLDLELRGNKDMLGAITRGADALDELDRIRREVKAYDDDMGDKKNDGADARPPDGDDYNELISILGLE